MTLHHASISPTAPSVGDLNVYLPPKWGVVASRGVGDNQALPSCAFIHTPRKL